MNAQPSSHRFRQRVFERGRDISVQGGGIVSAKQGDPEMLIKLLADARHLDPARISLGCGTESGKDGNVALAAVGEEVDFGIDIVDTVDDIVGVTCKGLNASRPCVSLGGLGVTWGEKIHLPAVRLPNPFQRAISSRRPRPKERPAQSTPRTK